MSSSEILYVKGMNLSESDADHEDIWDDKKLNDAYDKALRIANAEVAKRVAMSTNTQPIGKNADTKDKNAGRNSGKPSQKQKKQWKAGMPCRAVYEGDGQEYEAFLLRMISDQECVVRFLGYDNSEIVEISSLKQTLGNAERTRQIEDTLVDKLDGANSDTFHIDMPKMESSDRALSIESSDVQRRKKSSKKKKPKQKLINSFDFPEMPLPNFSQLRDLGSMEMPIPPPPPLALHHHDDSEDQAVSSMLLSWYMSGYYTGLYQGMKRAKESRKN